MIALVRDRERITSALRGHLRRRKNLELVKARADGTLAAYAFESGKWKAAKAQLRTETHGKCAYCEASTSVVAHGDVEHLRPKSRYWWLAFFYENYTFACQICNQSYKGDLWEIDGPPLAAPVFPPGTTLEAEAGLLTPDPRDEADGAPWAPFWEAVDRELALVPDPYRERPEELLGWRADDSTRRVYAMAVPHADPAVLARRERVVDAMVRLLGLDRDELALLRFDRYEDVVSAALLLRSSDAAAVADARRRVVRYTSPDAQFAGMARWFLSGWGVDWRALGGL